MHVRNHMALCAPAYGGTAKALAHILTTEIEATQRNLAVDLRLTKMADSASSLETNTDVEEALLQVLNSPDTAAIIFNVALCDFEGQIGNVPSGKYAERLQTRAVTEDGLALTLRPTKKLLGLVHRLRPDIVSVGFKTTANESVQIQVDKSNRMSREAGISWMLANDTVTRNNVVLRGSVERTIADAVFNGTARTEALSALAVALLNDIQG